MSAIRRPFDLTSRQGDPIRGDLWEDAFSSADAAIVVCHGFKGFKDWGFFPYSAAQLVRGAGCSVITFNFSGNGVGDDLLNFTELDKFEQNTFSKELDDLATVLAALEEGRLPGGRAIDRVGLLGHSRGGVISIVAAGEDPRVRCLVTWNSVALLDRWSDEQKAEWRRTGRIEILNTRTGQLLPLGVGLLEDAEANADRFDPVRAVSRLEVPYLIVHAADDESVGVAEGERLAKAATGARFERIEGAGHTFGAVHPFAGTTPQLTRVLDLTAEWFASHLASA